MECTPTIIAAWGIWEQNAVWTEQEWYILSISYKWLGEKTTKVIALPDYKGYEKNRLSDRALLEEWSKVWNQADEALAHNGDSFDVKKINARMIINGLQPLKPITQIDTKKMAKRFFNFNSNKLQELGRVLNVGSKLQTGGADLWRECMAGDMKAWAKMKRYNKQDVVLLEKVYLKLRSFDQKHPHSQNIDGCKNCGSTQLQSRGILTNRNGVRQRYQCSDCGTWNTSKEFIKRFKPEFI